MVVDRLSETAGVALSGTVRVSGTALAPVESARLHVGGRLSGELSLHGRVLAGSLGGTHVHVQLGAL